MLDLCLFMHEFFSLGFTLHKCFGGTFSLARNFCFWFSLPPPSLFLWSAAVPFGRHANDTLTIGESPGNEGIRNALQLAKISLHSVKEAIKDQSTY